MSDPIAIDIVSDVVCPWCFLGKRRLEKALTMFPEQRFAIRWRPFQLDSTIPREGMSRQLYMERKFGSAERIAELHAPLIAAGKAEGIPFAFDRITRSPNTLNAHRLIRWAGDAGKQDQMVERLFNLYFVEGGDLSDNAILIKAAVDAGLDGALVTQLLATDADLDPVIAEINGAQEMGITGVPTFIFAQRYGLSGAQPPETLKQAIEAYALRKN
jgi:predicted DsbA family dithiol-disulfide isomerase